MRLYVDILLATKVLRSIRLYKHKKHFKDFNDFEKRMNTRSRLVVPCDAFHIPRTSIKSQTSKSPVSHLAQDQNYQMNYCLFTYKDQIFKQTSRINEIRTRYNNKSKLIKKKNRTLNFSWKEDYWSHLSPNDKRPFLIKEAKIFDFDILSLQELRLKSTCSGVIAK